MISITFNAPHLQEEFKNHGGLNIQLSESLPLNCVAKMDCDQGDLVIKVSHVFRLLQVPVQEFMIHQFVFYNEFNKLGIVHSEAWERSDAKAFLRITTKYGNACDSIIIYATNIFTPLINHNKTRLKNLLLLYEANKPVSNEQRKKDKLVWKLFDSRD